MRRKKTFHLEAKAKQFSKLMNEFYENSALVCVSVRYLSVG